MKRNRFVTLLSTLLAISLTVVQLLPVPAAASPALYPVLPDLPGADVTGEQRLVIYLDQDVPLVEIDGGLYELDGRPLEVGFDGVDHVTLLLIVPRGVSVFVTEDGVWTRSLDPYYSTTLTYDLSRELVADPISAPEVGFEVTIPGQPAPIAPDVVIRPIEDDPEPA